MVYNIELREVSTDVFARAYQVKPETVRTRYCLTGSYFGHTPKKLPNGRLAWPNPELETENKEVA